VSSPTSNSSVGTSIWCFPEQLCSLCALTESSNDFFMELTHAFLQDSNRRSVFGARFTGQNVATMGLKLGCSLKQLSYFLTVVGLNPAPHSLYSLPLQVVSIQFPLDQGRSLQNLYSAIKAFMPENSVACLATVACCVMGATYQAVVLLSGLGTRLYPLMHHVLSHMVISVCVLFHAALLPEATDEVVPSADSEYTMPQLPLSMTEPQTGGAAVETSQLVMNSDLFTQ